MSSILFYTPFNHRSRDTESLMISFHEMGHKVSFLSQQEGYLIGDVLSSKGISVYAHPLQGRRDGWWYYIRHLLFFVSFCWKHRIEVVYSHLEPANFVASIGQYAIRARVFLCRHHVNDARLYKFDESISYRLTYKLARKIIVVSDRARSYMVDVEKIPARKIIHIDLAYNFDLYIKPSVENIKLIRAQYDAEILLVAAGRMVAGKRLELAVSVVRHLKELGMDAKLILLGKGDREADINGLIEKLGLTENVILPGYVDNVLEFVAAADFFLHPSIAESSCVVVKEAGLVNTPAIVCKSVGDFDEFIVDNKNSFLVDSDKFVESALKIIIENFNKKSFLESVGAELRKSVMDRFSIANVIGRYTSLNKIG